MMLALQALLIFFVPLAGAVLFGAIADGLGAKAMTGMVAMCGLCVGVYFLNVALGAIVVR